MARFLMTAEAKIEFEVEADTEDEAYEQVNSRMEFEIPDWEIEALKLTDVVELPDGTLLVS